MATTTRVTAPPRAISWVAGLFLVTAAVAFWPAYFSKLPAGNELYVDLHAAGVTAWMALLITQPLLIRGGRRALHRRLGALSYGLVPYIVVTATLLSHSRLDPVTAPTFREDATDNYLATAAIELFVTFYALAIAHRRNMGLHARFMTATLLTMVDPLTFRLLFFYSPWASKAAMFPMAGYGLADTALLALTVFDRRPAGRRVWPLLLAISVPIHLGYWIFAPTEPWIAAMAWFKALPIS